MSLKKTHAASEPILAADMNDHAAAIIQNSHNIYELFLENFFAAKITPFNGLFFDGFSDETKKDTISGIEFDTTNKLLQFPFPAGETGDGSAGDVTVTTTVNVDTVNEAVTASAASGQKVITVANGGAFTVGEPILIHQSQGTGAGNFDFAKIASISVNDLTLDENLLNAYDSVGAQIIELIQYNSLTIDSGGTLTAAAWDGTTGGLVAFLVKLTTTVNTGGTIKASDLGFRGGTGGANRAQAQQGESDLGIGIGSTSANGAGGGGAIANSPSNGAGGGGAGHSAVGQDGVQQESALKGFGGGIVGVADLSTMLLGSGGGGSSHNSGGQADGGRGAGLIVIIAESLIMGGGTIAADGQVGGSSSIGAGGGAGGSILLKIANTLTFATDKITALAGGAGQGSVNNIDGGTGAKGRIANSTDFVGSLTGTTDPTINNNGTLAGLFGAGDLTGVYESIVTAFQITKETIHLWIVRNFVSQFNLDSSISGGATTLTILGDKTSEFANGDTIDISKANNNTRERKTLTAVPSFGGGVTTLTFSATDNAFGTSDFVERVDVLPTISLVDSGTAKSFQTPDFVQSIVDFASGEVEDEYILIATPEEDLKIKIDVTRNTTTKRPIVKRLGVVANE